MCATSKNASAMPRIPPDCRQFLRCVDENRGIERRIRREFRQIALHFMASALRDRMASDLGDAEKN